LSISVHYTHIGITWSDEQVRAVHVASQGIVEALRKLYQPAPLLR
jgi:hypothetical protein